MGLADDRKTMIACLQETSVEELRSLGFDGSFPHFRRRDPAGWSYLSFQFDRYGGGFAVEIGKRKDGEATHPQVPDGKVTSFHVQARQRLGTLTGASDHWFRYDGRRRMLGPRRFTRLVLRLERLLESEAIPWWDS